MNRDDTLVRTMKFSFCVFPKTVNAQMFWQMSCLLRTADLKLRFPSGLINCPPNVPFPSQFTKEIKIFLQKKDYCYANKWIFVHLAVVVFMIISKYYEVIFHVIWKQLFALDPSLRMGRSTPMTWRSTRWQIHKYVKVQIWMEIY